MNRRKFLKSVAYGTGAAVATGLLSSHAAAAADTREGDMIYRTLGRTGEKVSVLGLGGYLAVRRRGRSSEGAAPGAVAPTHH